MHALTQPLDATSLHGHPESQPPQSRRTLGDAFKAGLAKEGLQQGSGSITTPPEKPSSTQNSPDVLSRPASSVFNAPEMEVKREPSPSQTDIPSKRDDSKCGVTLSRTGKPFGDTVQIFVGPSDQVFVLHMEFVPKIPFIKKACSRRSIDRNDVHLPKEDPEVFQRVMKYVYFGQIPHLDAYITTEVDQNAGNDQCYEVIKTYLLASKLDMEHFANQLISLLHRFQGMIIGTTVKEMHLMQSMENPCLPVRTLLLRSLAESIRDGNWRSYFDDSPLLEALLESDASLAMGLAEILSMKETLPDLAVDNDYCQYHTHDKTKKCTINNPKAPTKGKKRKLNAQSKHGQLSTCTQNQDG